MSIAQKQPKGTLTEPSRALALFTDRTDALRLFAGRIHADPAVEKVIFFYGDGGNGKTLLLRWLQANACKLLPPRTWERVRAIGDDAAFRAAFVEAEGATVPYAVLDFGATPQGVNRPQEGFYALLMLRRQLAACGLTFPLFDFAVLCYLKETKQLTTEEVHSLFPGDALDLIDALLGTVTSLPWFGVGKALLNLFDKRLGERFTLYRKQRNLPEEEVTRIARLPANPDLLDLLPELFALDLNAAMQLPLAPERLALFFDTHEALWGAQRNLADAAYFARDAWLRRFLCHLDLNADVTVVVAGRDRPRWPEAAETPIPTDYLDPHLVGHLSPADATDYLTRAGVADPDLRRHLAAYTTGHPYYLGLCADIVVAAGERGENLTAPDFEESSDLDRKGRQLVERLLKWVDDDTEHAVRALCAARSFDWDVYAHLARELHFAATEPAFKRLTQFSFVQPLPEAGKPRYRMHELLRRLLDDPVRQRAHVALEAYYRGHADELERVEAIYHLNQRDAEGSWNELFDSLEAAVRGARWNLCKQLAEVRRTLPVLSDMWLGSVLQFEGDFSVRLSRYLDSVSSYEASIAAYDRVLKAAPDDIYAHSNKAITQASLGALQATLGQHAASAQSYAAALEVLDRALVLAPAYAGGHNNRGLVLQGLADLQTSLGQYAAAAATYRKSVAAYDSAMALEPLYADARNNKGLALERLGELQTSLGQYHVAAKSFAAAIAVYDRALDQAPDDVRAINNKSLTLFRLGELQATLGQNLAAARSFAEGVAACDHALTLAPDDVHAHDNKGNALASLGKLQASLGQHAEAAESYEAAVVSYDRGLALAPDAANTHCNKGTSLLGLGKLQASLGQLTAAAASYGAAVSAYDRALNLARDYVLALNNKGNALQNLGDLQAGLGDHLAAASYTSAIAACDRVLELAPDLVLALNTKGLALQSLGDFQASLGREASAAESYHAAVRVYQRALVVAPDDVDVLSNMGLALRNRGQLQASAGQHEAAAESYCAALVAHDRVLARSPDLVAALNNKGNTLQRLGELQVTLGHYAESEATYSAAIAAYNRTLQQVPGYVNGHTNRGSALLRLAVLYFQWGRIGGACVALRTALAEYDCALALAPGRMDIQSNRALAQKVFNEIGSSADTISPKDTP